MRYSFLIYLAILSSCNTEPDRIKPRVTNITESVYATVTILPKDMYEVYPAVGGIIDEIYVEEGEEVTIGQKLMDINNSTPELNVENARLALELAEKEYRGNTAVLKRIRDDIAVAELNLRQDSIDFARQKKLWENKIGTENEFDRKKLTYEISRNNLKRLRDELERTRVQLETQLKQAQNRLETSQVNAGEYVIQSKINGKVYSLYKEEGEFVNSQQPLASVGSAGDFVITMLVDEVDISRLESGQRVLVSLDAFPEAVYEGRITRILPRKDERTQTFTVEATFTDPPGNLYAGLSGEANIVIAQKESALVIPRKYLLGNDQVRTEEGLIPVETGLSSMEAVEILSGIDSSTFIYADE